MRGKEGWKKVESRNNPLYRELRRLAASSRERRTRGLCLLEGEKLVRSGLSALGSLPTLVFTPDSVETESAREFIGESPRSAVVLLGGRLFRDLSSFKTPSGLMAVAPIPVSRSDDGDLLLIDGVQDPGNLGMILRSAAAAGTRRVLLSDDSADAWSPKVLRAGMGAHFRLSLQQGLPLPEEAERFGGEVMVLHHRGAQSLYETDLTASPLALAVGSEGRGVSEALLRRCDRTVAIPMPGWDEPLNAAAAVAVCLFEMVRQRAASRRQR